MTRIIVALTFVLAAQCAVAQTSPNGKMVLSRDAVLGNGKPGLQRMTFYNIAREQFDWDWQTSEDSGKTWTVRWRIHYQRKT